MRNTPNIDRNQIMTSRKTRPTIGVLTTENIVRYLPLNWLGPLDAAKKHAVNHFSFIGGPLRTPEGFLAQAAVIFDLVNPEQFDGLIIWAEAVGPFLTKEELRNFCQRYTSVPIVTIERTFEGIPAILMDNYQSMREAMIHLIDTHGYRRIAFLRGPAHHLGAQERYRAYVETLAEYGIPFDENLVSPPCEEWDGDVKTALLLDERQAAFEAVATAADHLTICALRVLQARGISVPDDIALIGFDDCLEGRTVTPPLTTLRAPFYEMGQQAVEMVLALIDGQQVPEQVFVPATLMVRQSCGCPASAVVQATAKLHLSETTATAGEINLSDWRDELLSRMLQVGNASLANPSHDRIGQFLDQFMAALNAGSANLFARAVDRILSDVAADNGEVTVWQSAVSALRQHLLPLLRGEMLARAENLWQQARVAIGEMAQRVEAHQRVQDEQRAQTLREIGQVLITTFDENELMDVLAQGLSRLRIPRAYLALYEDPQNPYALSRLILAYDDNRRIHVTSDQLRFPSQQLIPAGMLPYDKACSMVVEPFYFREHQLGFGVFEVGSRDVNVYGALRSEISSAIQGALLVRQTQQHRAELAYERDLLHTLMNSSPDYLFFKDRESRFVRTNTAHAQLLLGLKGPEEAVGKTDFDLFPRQEAQRFFEEEQRIMETGKPVVAREWWLHSSTTGELVWLSEHKVPIIDAAGHVVGLVGISRDVTAQKQAEAALAREKYIVDTFMANVPDFIYFKDRESRFIRVNQALATVLGLDDPAELVGKTDFDLTSEVDARAKYETEQQVLRTGQPILDLEESDAPSGPWFLTTKMPLRDEHDNIIGTFGISRDITDLKQAQLDVAAAYEEIRMLNEQLQEENLRMGTELDVSRRIQQMVLPSPQELQQIPGLDIVGYMQPADEVGGDYYDVLTHNGAIHVGIGDVTGHGLESGILMLMTQTAIRTLVEHGETDPLTFLTTLNRVILKNAQRMHVDKTLTFALVNYEDRQLKIVGQHEEVLVVRNGGLVERIDTVDLGFPIGLKPEISKWIGMATVSLEPGDSLVLYTDGITEAENAQRAFYGIERLCSVLSDNWTLSAEAIKQAVIADVLQHIGGHTMHDDLTLVVLKKTIER